MEDFYGIRKDTCCARRRPHGVRGIVNEDFVDLTQETRHNLELVANTPSSALGPTRDKPDLAYCQEIFKVLQAHEIEHFFYIGAMTRRTRYASRCPKAFMTPPVRRLRHCSPKTWSTMPTAMCNSRAMARWQICCAKRSSPS
jgi:hypothetical protein